MKKLSIGFGGYEANSKLGGKCWWKCQEARLKSYSDRFSLIKFWTACDCLQFPGSRMNESTRHLIHRPSNLIIEWFDHSIKEYNVYIYIYIYYYTYTMLICYINIYIFYVYIYCHNLSLILPLH
jgi:hypothetical protein